MSATMTMTMAQPATIHMSTTPCCPQCGFGIDPLQLDQETHAALAEAQRQIEDLQAQVRLLNQKAAAAVDRWADYEDELSKLRQQVSAQSAAARQQQQQQQAQAPPSPTRSSFLSTNRISALLSPRSAKSTPDLKTPPSSTHTSYVSSRSHQASQSQSQVGALQTPRTPYFFPPGSAGLGSPTPSAEDLLEALSREQSLRLAAEGKLTATSREVEELSVTLFEQANEMVATERRARAKLEERVEVLEKRDVEKRKRLDRLESAMNRIERVRAMLGESDTKGGLKEDDDKPVLITTVEPPREIEVDDYHDDDDNAWVG